MDNPEVIDLISSSEEDENDDSDISCVLAGNLELSKSSSSGSSHGSVEICTVDSSVDSPRRRLQSHNHVLGHGDCDGHRRPESTHLESHFYHGQEPSIMTEDRTPDGDDLNVTDDDEADDEEEVGENPNGTDDLTQYHSANEEAEENSGTFATAPSNIRTEEEDAISSGGMRLRLSTFQDDEDETVAAPGVRFEDEADAPSRTPTKAGGTLPTPLKSTVFFSIGKRKSLGLGLKATSVLAEESEDEDDFDPDDLPPSRRRFVAKKPDNRRRSFLGRNEVLLLPSDDDEDDAANFEESIRIRPEPTSPQVKRKNVEHWVAKSPFASPSRTTPKTLVSDESSSDISLAEVNRLLIDDLSPTSSETEEMPNSSLCTSNRHSAKILLSLDSFVATGSTQPNLSECTSNNHSAKILRSQDWNGSLIITEEEEETNLSECTSNHHSAKILASQDCNDSPITMEDNDTSSRAAAHASLDDAKVDASLQVSLEEDSEAASISSSSTSLVENSSSDSECSVPPPSFYHTAPNGVFGGGPSSLGLRAPSGRKPKKEISRLQQYFAKLRDERERRKAKEPRTTTEDVGRDNDWREKKKKKDRDDSSCSDKENSPVAATKCSPKKPPRGLRPTKILFSPDVESSSAEKEKDPIIKSSDEDLDALSEFELPDIDSPQRPLQKRTPPPAKPPRKPKEKTNWKKQQPTTENKKKAPPPISRKLDANDQRLTFLESLTLLRPDERCHLDAAKYLTHFSKHRVELAERLFELYNEEVFACGIPKDTKLVWAPRLLRTAGTCVCKKRVGTKGDKSEDRYVQINLATKVLDSADRLRDTLIHEMCHAATWILSGYHDGHGPLWKDWARRSMQTFPALPIIGRCHSYKINTKFTYRCTKCSYEFGRHSKSMDMDRMVCGKCRGKFELLVNHKSSTTSQTPGRRVVPKTPKAPNAFAVFVKENYKTFRTPGTKHADAMKGLSAKFAASKI